MLAVTVLDGLGDLNWLAVLVATIAWFAYSAVYYSLPFISKAWQAAAKIPPQEGAPLPAIMAATVVLYFIVSTVIGLLVQATGTTELTDGIVLGVTLGVAFGAATGLISQMYEQKGSSYWVINGINAIVSFAIVAGILTVMD